MKFHRCDFCDKRLANGSYTLKRPLMGWYENVFWMCHECVETNMEAIDQVVS